MSHGVLQTVRLIVEDGMEINAIEIVRSLPEFQEEITGIVPNFGGKCTQIYRCCNTPGHVRFWLWAGTKAAKTTGSENHPHLGVCCCRIPWSGDRQLLKQYGQLKSENLRRLYYTDEGFTNIEHGILVAEFTSLDRDLPRKVVTQDLEIFFKYTGQPITCYRCGSTEHVVKNCPKQAHASDIYARRIAFSLPHLTSPLLRPRKIHRWKRPGERILPTKSQKIFPQLKIVQTILC